MTSPALELCQFSLSSQTARSATPRPLLLGSELILPETGIYTLEGDNQAGKSTLLKVLMGVLSSPTNEPITLKLQGETFVIRNIADAMQAGMGAVFQDDTLIPSLTVAQQLVLIHAQNQLQRLLSFAHRNHGPNKATSPNAIIDQAKQLLSQYGEDYISILSKYPTQLSGGALAIAKIVKVQLQKPLRLLFLDEAFSGVQRDVWPEIIEKLRAWSLANNVTLMAVTHNEEEIGRWRPLIKFVIREQTIRRR